MPAAILKLLRLPTISSCSAPCGIVTERLSCWRSPSRPGPSRTAEASSGRSATCAEAVGTTTPENLSDAVNARSPPTVGLIEALREALRDVPLYTTAQPLGTRDPRLAFRLPRLGRSRVAEWCAR